MASGGRFSESLHEMDRMEGLCEPVALGRTAHAGGRYRCALAENGVVAKNDGMQGSHCARNDVVVLCSAAPDQTGVVRARIPTIHSVDGATHRRRAATVRQTTYGEPLDSLNMIRKGSRKNGSDLRTQVAAFGNEVSNAEMMQQLLIIILRARAHGKNGGSSGNSRAAHVHAHFDAIHTRHVQVQKHRVGRILPKPFDR